MPHDTDFIRLNRALDDAVEALPVGACTCESAALRRQCREVVLLLLQARERVRRLTEMFGQSHRGPG